MCSSVLHVFRVHSPFTSVGLGWCDATVQNVGWSKRLPCEEVFSFDLVRDLLWHIRDNVGQESSQTEHDVLWLKTKHFTTRISPWIDRESSQGVQYYFNLFIISNGSILFSSQLNVGTHGATLRAIVSGRVDTRCCNIYVQQMAWLPSYVHTETWLAKNYLLRHAIAWNVAEVELASPAI